MFARIPCFAAVPAVLLLRLLPGVPGDLAAQTLCAGVPVPQVSVLPNPLDPTDSSRRDVGQLRYRGGVLLQHDDHRFGAFSGMVVSADGNRLVAANDGFWLDAALRYDGAGNLSGFQATCFGQLLDEKGQPLKWWEDQDAESLTFDGEQYLIGFEENLRVWAYRDFSEAARNVPLPPDFVRGVPPGAGYSSIASDGPGRFYLITEFARNAEKDTKGYVSTESARGDVWIVSRDGPRVYLPVDLAVMPNDDFVLAEISLVQLSEGVFDYQKLRLSVIEKADLAPGARVTPTTIAEMEPPLIQEKYEAISSRSGPNGETLIYLMSDDGRRRGGRTIIRMFELVGIPQ
ncbi:MAG: esterase-like activity of phytase family protein [Vicinamibacterales bacterium]